MSLRTFTGKRWWPPKQNTGSCSIDGCDEPAVKRHMCNRHYLRSYRHGDPAGGGIPRDPHRLSHTKEYRAWKNMLARCRNPNHPSYPRYGGRGIEVCRKWEGSFLAFLDNIGPAPSREYSIDRINNDGNYEPANCRWVLPIENARNTSRTKLTPRMAAEIRAAYAAGRYQLKKDLAAAYGIAPTTLRDVLMGKRWAR